MSKARQLADNGAATPNRNMVINGAMNVAQRGTSSTGLGASSGYFTVDRFKSVIGNSAGRFTMTQTADGPVGFANCIKLDCTTADTSIAASEYFAIAHYIEGQNLQRIGKGESGAKQITLSFYVKANGVFNFAIELYDADNARQITKLYATTTSWVKHEITFPADEDDGSSPFDDDNATSLLMNFWLHAGSEYTGGTLNSSSWANDTTANRAAGISSFFSSTDNNFFITGVQLEVGSSATPFEHKTFAQDLHECERYYQRIAATSDAYKRFGNLFAQSATLALVQIPLTQTLRAIPTIVSTGTAANYGVEHASTVTPVNSALSIKTNSDDGTQSPHVYISTTVGSGLTTGQGGVLLANNNTSAFVGIDSEL